MEKLRPTPKPRPKKRPRPNEKNVIVEMPTGELLHFMVEETCTVENVKELIFQEVGIPVESQCLVVEVRNERAISSPVVITAGIQLIMMPVYYYDIKTKEKADEMNASDEGGEEEEDSEDTEQEDAKNQEEPKGDLSEFSSQDWIGAALLEDGQGP